MNQDPPPGCSDYSRIGMNMESSRRRDPKSRELLGPLFGQVAVATVRNVLFNSVANLQNVDKLLASKVAQLRARKEQLQVTENEDMSQTVTQLLHQKDERLESDIVT